MSLQIDHPMRRLITADPFVELHPERAPWEGRGCWPCHWIAGPDAAAPLVAAYRRRFTLENEAVIRVHVSGDERYELYLDSVRIGRGSERGDASHWFYETYDLTLSKGAHVLVGKVWSLGGLAPVAQCSIRHGFILAPESTDFLPLLGTGVAEWEWKPLGGYGFATFPGTEGAGAKVVIDGKAYAWDFASGGGEGWQPAINLQAGASAERRNDYWSVHLMTPATLPPMVEEVFRGGKVRCAPHAGWEAFWPGQGEVVIPAGTQLKVLIDLENYVCAYSELTTSGGAGASVGINWAEALTAPEGKGNRDEIEGKIFSGIGNVYKPDGGALRTFEPLWWDAGRYLMLDIQTAETSLTIHRLTLRETHYPLKLESSFAASDPRFAQIVPILWRSLEMCAHETYMDCPYYEQLMYAGDTRTEVLATYAATGDDRLPRKALGLFAASRLASGLTQSRYPSRGTQIIPPFSLWWVAMIYDYALWRGDAEYVRSLMPVARNVMDVYIERINPDGLAVSPPGWNFTDWVDGWKFGAPPDGDEVSGVINLQFLLVLGMMEKLEAFCGRPELSAQARRLAQTLHVSIDRAFWNEEGGLYADDRAGCHFSEHAQCLAALAGWLEPGRRERVAHALATDERLARTSVYFSHYLFEACAALGRSDVIFQRLEFWFALPQRGCKTTPETADPCRSECHAWGAHPLYHYFATILGVRPGAMGFHSVRIAPLLGPLAQAAGKIVHPLGEIEVEFQQSAGVLQGTIRLPNGLDGEFRLGETLVPLVAGVQKVSATLPSPR